VGFVAAIEEVGKLLVAPPSTEHAAKRRTIAAPSASGQRCDLSSPKTRSRT
jgi:hypothetical protein